MNTQAEIFNEIVEERRSIRKFDQDITYDPSIVERSLQRAILSPNSSNMQLWEFYRILSADKKEVIAEACLGQLAAKKARELLVFVARPDKYKESIQHNLSAIDAPDNFEREHSKEARKKYYGQLMPLFYGFDFLFMKSMLKKLYVTCIGMKKPMVREVTCMDKQVTIHKSIALAAQTFMLSVRSEGYDTCPLEGYDSKRIKKCLGLPRRAQINMVIAVGPRAEDGVFYPRVRYAYDEVVKEL